MCVYAAEIDGLKWQEERIYSSSENTGPQLREEKVTVSLKQPVCATRCPIPPVLSHTDKWQCQMLENMSVWDGWAFCKASIDCAPVSLSDTHLIDVSVWLLISKRFCVKTCISVSIGVNTSLGYEWPTVNVRQGHIYSPKACLRGNFWRQNLQSQELFPSH